MIYERKQCKKWITVDIDKSKLKNHQSLLVKDVRHSFSLLNFLKILQNFQEEPIAQPKNSIKPTLAWQHEQVKDFLQLRQFVNLSIQNEPNADLGHESHWHQAILEEIPTFVQITCLKQSAKLKLIHIIGWHLDTIKAGHESMSSNVGLWIYSVLAALELPLSPSDCHDLRELARKLALVRSFVDEDAPESSYVHLNLCICLIARCFGQLDLADC